MTMRSTISGLTLVLTCLALPSGALAAEGYARASGILRAGPSTDYPVVARVSKGDDLEVFGCLARTTWCDVSVDDERGWLPGSRIEFEQGGRRQSLGGNAALFGLSILTFGRNDYWDEHYRGRSWGNDRRWNRDDRSQPNRSSRSDTRPGTGVLPDEMPAPHMAKPDRRPPGPAQVDRPRRSNAEGRPPRGPANAEGRPPRGPANNDRGPRLGPPTGNDGQNPPPRNNVPASGPPGSPPCTPPQCH